MNDLFYNRDRNVTGVTPLTGLSFSPRQGSSVVFSTRTYESPYPNKVKARMGQSLNSVSAEYSLSFGVRETEAAQIIDYFESRSGVLPAVMEDASSMYQTISGFVDEFSFSSAANNAFEANCKLVIDNRSVKTNWSGLSFLNFEFRPWQTGEIVPKYSIRYFEYDSSNKFNNYFYSTGDHISANSNGPFSTGSFWAQNMFFEQDVQFGVTTQPDVGKVEFNGAFPLRISDKKNIHNVESATLRFPNISEAKAKALLHFAETKFGETKFLYECPKIYKPKVFYCPAWRHTWNYFSHTVELDLIEDPLGILPSNDSPSISIAQNNGWANLTYQVSSSNGLNVVSYDGGEQNSLPNGQTVKYWDNSIQDHKVDIYGGVTGVSASQQRINYIEIGENSKIKRATFSGNYMQSANLGGSRNLQDVDLNHNSLNELSLDGLIGLKTLNISNNRIASLDITDCTSLTGLNVTDNLFSSAQISSHLDALVNLQNYSGNYDASINSPLSGQGFSDAAILGWRKWSLSFDNAEIPINPTHYSQTVSHFKQDSITGVANGQSIFTWDDSIGNFDASRIVVSDSLRPQYLEATIGQRSCLRFNGDCFVAQTGTKNLPSNYGVFAVVRPADSGRMTVFSDKFNRGLLISGNKLVSKANLTNNVFGELSGGLFNVVGFYSDGASISGAVNTQTPSVQSKSSNNLTFPGVIGMTYDGATGSSLDFPYIGDISEIIVTSGVTDFARMMRDLGAKHGLEIL